MANMTIKLKGKDYEVKPLSAAMMVKHAEMMRDAEYAQLKKSLIGLPAVLCNEIFSKRAAEIRKIEHGSSEHRRSMITFGSMSAAIYLFLQSVFPEAKPEDGRDLLDADPGTMAYAAMALLRMPITRPAAESAENAPADPAAK